MDNVPLMQEERNARGMAQMVRESVMAAFVRITPEPPDDDD